ncbi:hypothetical protein DL96DRAFT_1009660 [Flagelloscypha sp. PMI_526]|nr:hypothetical protein DL96DRAFT_1009660 [Flagelloscypha sp. PMI_526]
MTRVAIRSVHSGRYLGLDGRGITSFVKSGAGRAFPQNFIGRWETFILHTLPEGAVAFESAEFRGVFLRLVGAGLSQGSAGGQGGGQVNGQFGCSTREKFNIKRAEGEKGKKGSIGIESHSEPGRFIRMKAETGVVNVQVAMQALEEFEILIIDYMAPPPPYS